MGKTKAGPIAAQRLKSFVERIEKLEEERGAIGSDIKDVYSEAKGVGYDVKTMRWLVQERKQDAADRDERDALRDTYAHALGMAVNMVLTDGLSLREAGRQTGVSKSSIHRALAVPEVSQTAPVDEPAGQRERIGHNSKRACILPRPDAWKEITSARDAHEAAVQAAKDAERERRRAERERIAEENRRADEDTLELPPFLKRQPQAVG